MTTYDLGLSAATGKNFQMKRAIVDADTLREAIEKAEAEFPGFRVHHGWATGEPVNQEAGDDMEWMANYRHPTY